MKKTLISLTLTMLLAGNAVASENAVSDVITAKNEAIQEIKIAKEEALNAIQGTIEAPVAVQLPELTEVAPLSDSLSMKDFELKIAASKKFDNYGGVEVIRDLTSLGLGSFYEIKLGGKDNGIMSGDTNFVFLGDVIKFTNGTHVNISADYRTSIMESAAKTQVESLSEEVFITYAPTVDKIGTLYVYTDTTCGYCRKLHNEIEELTSAGVEVKYIPYPRSGSDEKVPVSRDANNELVYGENKTLIEMASIYCHKDPAIALTAVKSGGSVSGYKEEYDANKEVCNAIIKKGYESGQKIGFGGTPFLYLDNGTAIPGYQPATAIIKMFQTKK